MINNEKTGGGIYAPQYYRAFRCIADKCRHSCCIGWEICIDEETYEKYKQIKPIADTVTESDDGPCFALCADGRCPHLNASGLCNIILSHGEAYLSEICQNHPRFYNDINSTRTEAGIGIVCEEACRLIMETEAPLALIKIEDAEDDVEDDGTFDALPHRDRIISMIGTQGDFDEAVIALKTAFDLPKRYDTDAWLDRFLALEILDESWACALYAMRGKCFCTNGELFENYGKYYARLLTYFVYRHVSVADSLHDLRARLAFSLLSVEIIRLLFENGTPKTLHALIDIARRYSAEIEYSEDNTAELILAFEILLK